MRYYINDEEVSEKEYFIRTDEKGYRNMSKGELLNEMCSEMDRLINCIIHNLLVVGKYDRVEAHEYYNTFYVLLGYLSVDEIFNQSILTLFNLLSDRLLKEYKGFEDEAEDMPNDLGLYFYVLGLIRENRYIDYDFLMEEVDTEKNKYSDAILNIESILYFTGYKNYKSYFIKFGKAIADKMKKKYEFESSLDPLPVGDRMTYQESVINELYNNKACMVDFIIEKFKEF